MSTCSAYCSLLSAVVSNAQGPTAKAQVAGRIKETSQAMLLQVIKVANYIGMSHKSKAAELDERNVPPSELDFQHGTMMRGAK